MASATTEITLVYGQWTQVAANNVVGVVTPKVKRGRFIVRYLGSQPSAALVVGHEYDLDGENLNLMVGGHQTMAAWMRPLEPAEDVVVVRTEF